MSKLVARGYIIEGLILALTSLFYLPQRTQDIRMVFNEIKIGLNYSLWGPNFMFPSMVSLVMMMGPNTNMVDLHFGETFYTF